MRADSYIGGEWYKRISRTGYMKWAMWMRYRIHLNGLFAIKFSDASEALSKTRHICAEQTAQQPVAITTTKKQRPR